MLYPTLTIAAGALLSLIALLSIATQFKSGVPLRNHFRFLISGILLMGHSVITTQVETVILSRLGLASTSLDAIAFAHWGSIAAVIAVQLVILPTTREMYTDYLSGKSGRIIGVNR